MARTRITNRNTQGVVTLPLPYGNLLAPGGGVVVTDDAATVITNLGGPAVVVACGLGVDALASAESATPSPPLGDPALGGDLSGTASAATVLKLNGNNLNSAGARSALGLGSSATHAASDFAGAGSNTSSVAPGVTDGGHSHSFTGTAQIWGFPVTWLRPAAEGVTLVTATAKGDAQPKVAAAQPDCCRMVAVQLSGAWASTEDVTVTIQGVCDVAAPYSAAYVIPANSVAGSTVTFYAVDAAYPLLRVTSVSWSQPAGWSAGTFAVITDVALAVLPLPYYSSGTATVQAEKAGAAGGPLADANAGTLYRSALGSGVRPIYEPTTALDGLTDVVAYVRIDENPGGSTGSAVTNLTVNAHTHAQQAS